MTPEKLAELEKLEAAATPEDVRVKFDSVSRRPALFVKFDTIVCYYLWSDRMDADAELHAALRNNARALFAALREALRERDEAWAALEEREMDMHIRIRKGYDKTVADSWRAHCAKIEAERDEALARCEKLRELADVAAGEQGLAQRRMMEAQRERNKLRAEVGRLTLALLGVK